MDKDKLEFPTPGEILLEEFMKPKKLSIGALAKELKVDKMTVSRIVNCKSSITVDVAFALSKYFGTTIKFWLSLQMQYDIRKANERYTGFDIPTGIGKAYDMNKDIGRIDEKISFESFLKNVSEKNRVKIIHILRSDAVARNSFDQSVQAECTRIEVMENMIIELVRVKDTLTKDFGEFLDKTNNRLDCIPITARY